SSVRLTRSYWPIVYKICIFAPSLLATGVAASARFGDSFTFLIPCSVQFSRLMWCGIRIPAARIRWSVLNALPLGNAPILDMHRTYGSLKNRPPLLQSGEEHGPNTHVADRLRGHRMGRCRGPVDTSLAHWPLVVFRSA